MAVFEAGLKLRPSVECSVRPVPEGRLSENRYDVEMTAESDGDEVKDLEGWKQIASYLDKSIPTVRRYFKQEDLPVVRRGGRYFARTEDLDEWKWRQKVGARPPSFPQPSPSAPTSPHQQPEPPSTVEPALPPRESSPAAKARAPQERPGRRARLLILVLAASLLVHGSDDEIARAVVEGKELVALGAAGDEIWRRTIPDLTAEHLPIPPSVHDADGDGRNDVLLGVDLLHEERGNGRLVCFASTGEELWDFDYGRRFKLHGRDFEHYQSHHFRWFETWQGPRIVLVARHAMWFPAQIVLLEPANGKKLGEYWHPGYVEAIELVDMNADGRVELLLGGINNPGDGDGHPSLAILDIPFSKATPGARNYFETAFENGGERAYLLLSRPDLYKVGELAYVAEIHPRKNHRSSPSLQEVELQLVLSSQNRNVIHLTLNANLEVIEYGPSDRARGAHDQFFADGVLDHPYRPEEMQLWRKLRWFSTAPDGNALDVRRILSPHTVLNAGSLKEKENN